MARYLPDANILINALRSDAMAHRSCRDWLEDITQNGHEIAICELVECALLRICTLPRNRLVPMETTLAFWQSDLWTYPKTIRIQASPAHNRRLMRFITDLDLSGNDINDAWLAALAIEHRATLVSLGQGFSRFPGLAWINPASPAPSGPSPSGG